MSIVAAAGAGGKGKRPDEPEGSLALPAIGLEAEFTLVVDDVPTTPEKVFADPRGFLERPLMHRVGTSYHLPNGGAVYFDTGVVEVVTPAIELERGAPARAVRSLWESIAAVREGLDAWQREQGCRVRLAGFSTHYNISIELPASRARDLPQLARLLTYILPAPVMLLAANRRSTGIGVRPRITRIEVTADFTPDAALQVAAASLIAGIVRQVSRWPAWTLAEARRHGIPIVAGFTPMPHTSRKGWLARADRFPQNPFATPPNIPAWAVQGEDVILSTRQIASRLLRRFALDVARVADPFALRLIRAVIGGRATSLLDLADRPASYDDVGRLCRWEEVVPARFLRRSRYERVLMRAIARTPLHLPDGKYVPTAMRGWSSVVFTRMDDGARRIMPVDALLAHLHRWE